MASKRKKTTPCMIPSKHVRVLEDTEQDPAFHFQNKISAGGRLSPLDLEEPQRKVTLDDANEVVGTYTCKPCNFKTHDLNLFLDHVYSGHPEFRSNPGFLCLTCEFSAPKFEGLALHNARVHPTVLNTTLQLRKKERGVVVEQSLVSGLDPGKDNEISITKTPIMRMLKCKSEPKRIVVSHSSSEDTSFDPNPVSAPKEPVVAAVTHVSTIIPNGTTKVSLPSAIQIVNGSGALPLLKTPITQVVSVVQNRNHQSSPNTSSTNGVSSSSSSSSKNLPKVMIPLSSIPTYNAAMDSSSFLKTSFSKFPYPTKAELCYLTVVTKFPEEQIKIWFTAQRLKQGISWSPEEIEEARRKMFNTIIQTAPNGNQSNHSPAQHTITVLPASLGVNGIPQILQGSLQGGVIVTQPVVANGIQVNSAPVALAVTPKPQAAARPTMQARPAAAMVADKGASTVVGTVGSITGSITSSSKSGGGGSSSVGNSSRASSSNTKTSGVNGKSNSAHISKPAKVAADVDKLSKETKKTPDSKSVNVKSKPGNKEQTSKEQPSYEQNVSSSKSEAAVTEDGDLTARDSLNLKSENASSPASKSASSSPAASNLCDTSFSRGKKSQVQLGALKGSFEKNQFPDQEEVDRLIGLTGLTVREVRKWFSDRRYHYRNLKSSKSSTGGAGKSATEGRAGTPGSCADGSDSPMDLSEGSNSGAKTPQRSPSSQSPAASHTPTSPTTPSRRHPRAESPDFTAIRYKEREHQQIIALETSFAQDPDPSEEEVERLRLETKMTRRNIHGWFADKKKKLAAEKKREELEQELRDEETDNDGEESHKDDSLESLKVNPIKINLKMLKVTEANGKEESLEGTAVSGHSSMPSKTPSTVTDRPTHSPKLTTGRGKKTAEQLHTLKLVFARTHWPTATQYEEMLSATGLPRADVVRWFGDSRYMQKNGNLKWLEMYQNLVLEEDRKKESLQFVEVKEDSINPNSKKEPAEVAVCGSTKELVQDWLSSKMSVPKSETSQTERKTEEPQSLAARTDTGEDVKMEELACGVAEAAEVESEAH
ncbi:zinc fingers and homeoboxes protein 3 isoform 1-T2 [Synchiropus picturatus]